jgi:hypothetical protein
MFKNHHSLSRPYPGLIDPHHLVIFMAIFHHLLAVCHPAIAHNAIFIIKYIRILDFSSL